MNISEPFIRRPVATSLLMAAIGFVGLVAFPFLPRTTVFVMPEADRADEDNPGFDAPPRRIRYTAMARVSDRR